MLLLMVVALSLGLCDAKNIFEVEYKDDISVLELEKRLTEEGPDLDATEVAGLLAITKDKEFNKKVVFGGVRFETLLHLAERSDREPAKNCYSNYFNYITKICGKLSGPTGNIRLLDYCIHCYRLQFDFCANEPGGLFNSVMNKFGWISQLADISESITEWIVSNDKKRDSDEKNISGFMSQLANRYFAIETCAMLLKFVKEEGLFFDKHDEKTTRLLAEVEKTKSDEPRTTHVIYKRCAIINRLFTK